MEDDDASFLFEDVDEEEASNRLMDPTRRSSLAVNGRTKASSSPSVISEEVSVAGSILRQRKVDKRSSFLSDGYALIDSLQQQQQQREEPLQQQRRYTPQHSRESPVSLESAASITTTTELQQDEMGAKIQQRPPSLSLGGVTTRTSNEPFTSSLRRSVQVLQRQSTHTIRIIPRSRKQQQHQQQSDESTPPLGTNQNQASERPPQTETGTTAASAATTSRESLVLVSTILHLSAFAILGASLRIFVSWLFSGAGGAECNTTTTTTTTNVWCVTSSEGAFFADLPANMLGSFLLGLLQKPSQDLRLVAAPDMMGLAFLPSSHWFQEWGIVHMALRTAFCGSLTTFASWNTQMIRMLDGSAMTTTTTMMDDDEDGNNRNSQYVSAIFGYILGLQAALACLSFGQMVAIWMYRYTNPALAKEEDVLMYVYAKDYGAVVGAAEAGDGMAFKTKAALPDYEMRYLASLFPNEERRWAMQNVNILESLERWKGSTDKTRLCGDPHDKYLRALHQIEESVLVDEAEPANDLLTMAKDMEWDVAALQKFAKDAHGVSMSSSTDKAIEREASFLQTLFFFLIRSLPFLLAVGLVLLFVVLNLTTQNSNNSYRKQWLSALFAPLGALLRWKLSRFNGRLKGSWQWFPLGTFDANIMASIISAAVAGVTDSGRVEGDTVLEAILYAIKTGFAGSLSTVSSFVAEGYTLQTTYPHHAKPYYYMVGSLVAACAFSLVVYAPLVRTGPA
jgi:fluoride ion exporter CrcB/FEX